MNRRSLETKIGTVTLRNPVLLASGTAGYGLEYEGMIDLVRIGGVVTKTISYEPREGNPGRRLPRCGLPVTSPLTRPNRHSPQPLRV